MFNGHHQLIENVVTVELVGKENFQNDPLCNKAVKARLPIDEFIDLLLAENKRVTEGWLNCERYKSIPIIVSSDKRNNNKKQLDDV